MSHIIALVSQILGIKLSRIGAQVKAAGTADEDAKCCVCLSRQKDGEITRRLSCSHLFHGECVDRWLALRGRTCPLCRMSIEGGRLRGGPTNRPPKIWKFGSLLFLHRVFDNCTCIVCRV
uniref:RING-type E3 ubiquitin transferase n=1 Tax=Ananas comosus var. bracteatus TaxID=296719 RepID=A0A6V7QKU3_ANACO|nr:unnamed protein product [Ananas comosus var. bracteatus]